MSILFLLPLWIIGAAIVDGTHEHKKNRARMTAGAYSRHCLTRCRQYVAKLLQAICGEVDDVDLYEDARGNLHAVGYHHDGRNTYDLYMLSARGLAYFRNNGKFENSRCRCTVEALTQKHNRRAVRLWRTLYV